MTLSLHTAGWLALGLIAGAANVWLIRLAVDRYVRLPENRGQLALVPGLLVRVIVVTGLLYLAMRSSLVNGAVALVGFWLGRTLILRRTAHQTASASSTVPSKPSAEEREADQSLQ